jgi:deoxyadenosine/deoxycytidine kinase
VFASLSCPPADAERIAVTCALWSASLPSPDVLIGLSAQPATLRERIRRRGRSIEAGITDQHQAGLSRAFDAAFDHYTGKILRLRAETFDAYDPGHIQSLADQVLLLSAAH